MWTEIFLFTHRSESEGSLQSQLYSELTQLQRLKDKAIKHLRSHRFLHSLAEKTPAGTEHTPLHSLVSHLTAHNKRLFSSALVPCAVVSADACWVETHESRYWPCAVHMITQCNNHISINKSLMQVDGDDHNSNFPLYKSSTEQQTWLISISFEYQQLLDIQQLGGL